MNQLFLHIYIKKNSRTVNLRKSYKITIKVDILFSFSINEKIIFNSN
jgi:hypothetical protein